ncbi:ABC transporter transmembrane domain-containing protein [Spirochaeta cellobiosiphila]|uniref:ABC transporter transmembrane domain-containing protein n=1 Tax=Spirochaeta cellobiosiphila TaxID=504483 RepID=UPI00040D7E31|nr:ABC transporter transmembrane domain-containing protein [Spirochaeta cellobiosiphila]
MQGLTYGIINKFKASSLLLVLSSIGKNLLTLVFPLFFLQIYDRVIPIGNYNTLIWLTCIVLILIMVESFFNNARRRVLSGTASSLGLDMETKFFHYIIHLNRNQFNTMTRFQREEEFSKIQQVERNVRGSLITSFLDMPFLFLYLGAIYYLANDLVFFPILVLVSALLIYILLSLVLKNKIKKNKEYEQNKIEYISETLEKVHYLKSQKLETTLVRDSYSVFDRSSSAEAKVNGLLNISDLIYNLLSLILIYGTIIGGGFLVFVGTLSIGKLTACAMISRSIMLPFHGVLNTLLQYDNIKSSFLKLRELKTPSYSESDKRLIQQTEYSGYLSIKSHDNKGVNIKPGDIVGIIGGEEIAKESLRDILLGFERIEQNTVYYDEINVSSLNVENYLTSQVAYLDVDDTLLSGSIIDNISHFNDDYQPMAYAIASLLELDDFIKKLPHGYDTLISSRTQDFLPINIIQRISIARNLLLQPRYIISYQSDKFMNNENLEIFLRFLKNYCINSTIVLFTNRTSTLSACSRIVPLKELSNGHQR